MFNGMHGQARPRPHIDVAVVECMHMFIQERNVQQAVYPVKVKAFPNWDQEEQGDELNWDGRPRQYGGVTVGQSPKHQGRISCPNGDPAGQGP